MPGRAGGSDAAAVCPERQHGPLVVVVGKPLATILKLWRTEATRIGAIMVALIVFVLGTTLFLAREIGRRARGRGQARGTRDHRRAHRPEEPAQIRSRDRCRMAARGAAKDAGRAADDRCRPFQGLQRHLWASGRRRGAGRHRHLHFGFGAAGRRLRRALRRRGIRGAAAGALAPAKRSRSPKPSG